jgi:arylsulfatase A-like enzyme
MNFTIANYLLVILTGFFLNSCNQTTVPIQKNSPNILLILTDDMGYGDVANSGNPIISTPHLDQLAKQSVQFENFYVSSVCAPTRASLLTGRYHQRTGVRSVTNGFETIDPHEITLAEILKENEYRTGIF